ncbi:MAG: acyl-CoA dehydratase activase [Oscillospiraceae bacterium]|nr:acyl-CoA dehydratase activase [Oscillospiraceae bacterium]
MKEIKERDQEPRPLRLGIDIGSTTAKVIVLDPQRQTVLFSRYRRHHAEQSKTVRQLLMEVASAFPGRTFRGAVCGSGGKPVAEAMGVHYIQEVVANAAAVRALYPRARTAIELGGQDAKIIFFYYDKAEGRLIASDMRMNGSCAGGTGAFIDEVAALLKIPAEEIEGLAARGKTVHDISGRCGVFAKTDIQSVLNSGGRREDIALSAFHAIVKQTIGGLAQGLELKAPIIFEGGPLTFDPTLVQVFAQRLELREEDIIRPEHPETLVARGAALAVDELFPAGEDETPLSLETAIHALNGYAETVRTGAAPTPAYFRTPEEQAAWRMSHALPALEPPKPRPGDTLRVWLGIDAGSTTSKLVLLDGEERVVDRFYAPNHGDPLRVVRQGLLELYEKYGAMGVGLEILGLGTTGYGELMMAKGFGADFHTVETVAHAAAARKYVPDAGFVLDIGGQDMKAIWLSGGVVTNITLNEACSSGCGSFLENFASSLGIPAEEIAEAAFRSKHPAALGSRCTVFMNSTIITEQKNGRQPDDIMAGLCRSIIENVFTKVIRISGTAALGERVVVQGGTFKNDAVLRALEQYLGREVTRAPYPGEMGCIGAALLTKRQIETKGYGAAGHSRFIGFDALRGLTYVQKENVPCPHCANHCSRTLVEFSSGASYVTGNRCTRGETVDGAKDRPGKTAPAKDMYLRREALLFKSYPVTPVGSEKNITVGLPRTLEFWDSMPFWTTFFRALGYRTVLSRPSSRRQFERGIPFVPSDTVCFPAKLAHGHIRDLVEQGVDCIFMPMVMEMPSESPRRASNYVCAVVKGYPLIIRNSEDPGRRWHTSFHNPMFHWHTADDRKRQICAYMERAFSLPKAEVLAAFDQGEQALLAFRAQLAKETQEILDTVRKEGGFAVVLAGRPYHNDPLVSHDLSRAFTREGVPVLTVDALPGLSEADLRYTRAEITNNFHARMLSGAMAAARSPELEYVQIVSFGCGHDAILSDEISRIMQEMSQKAPLILKLDEGDAGNSLHIRVKSFLETVAARRAKRAEPPAQPLGDAYPAKFQKEDRKLRTVLIPNVSAAFCRMLSAVLQRQGLRAEPLPLGGTAEMQLAKKYVHNDTCFPAQMCIGEVLSALQSGKYPAGEVAVAMAKYQGDCRLSHYSALLRRAMDAAGFREVPIVSTDPVDSKEMHPGVHMGMIFNIQSLWALTMMDLLEELRRQIRPYELRPGETDRAFDDAIGRIARALTRGTRPAVSAFREAVRDFCAIPYDRSSPRPQVFVTGEYLVTFHPGSNFHIEAYLEQNGMEVILPRMTNVFRKDYLARLSEMKDYGVRYPLADDLSTRGGEQMFRLVLDTLEKIAAQHPLYRPCAPLPELAAETDAVMDHTFISGEGWLIPGEILEYAQRGVHAFVILQPFGCLPNHICGRGVMKRVKEEFPAIQILPLDLDPDTSFANVENRLQMLIMNEKSRRAGDGGRGSASETAPASKEHADQRPGKLA